MKKLLGALMVISILFTFTFIVGCNDDDGGGGGGIPIDSNDIGGTVEGSPGEAGVWVIAETDEVLTNLGSPGKYRKIVVTNDNGEFVIPDLPEATYDVWVRGYGLADSTPIQASPGEIIELQAVQASSPQEAAQVYPPNYWYSLFEPPPVSDFPGTGPEGNGIPESFGSQAQWVNRIKLGCELCHQLGTKDTRLPNGAAFDFGWKKANTMNRTADGIGRDVAIERFGDWGERIAAGEVPPQPPRPQGIERNFVITQWEWGGTFTYAHDEIATDKRNPTLYPNGPVYGVDLGQDFLLITDPVAHTSTKIKVPTVGGFDIEWCNQGGIRSGFCTLGGPAEDGTTAFPGVYQNPANPHNPMLDDTGKVWMTTQIRAEGIENLPDFCLERDPEKNSQHRQLGYYDTVTEEFVLIDTCYGNHHLQFDNDGILWSSGDFFDIGWFDPSKFDPDDPSTLSEAQNWSRVLVDSNGDGMADFPMLGFHYGIIPNPVDGTIWTGVLGGPLGFPGSIQRYDPATDTHEAYSPPFPGHGPRGIDADTNGNIWTCLGGSGHVAKFDRSKCAQTFGSTGDQCPEGWTLWETPGPQFKGVSDGPNEGSADFHYYNWVDQFNTSGLGANTVICNGTGSDSLVAFNPQTEQFTVIRIPYPLGFFQRGLDGRIDDPDAGWKGRGLWVDYGIDPIIHTETEQGQILQIQYRTSPLDH